MVLPARMHGCVEDSRGEQGALYGIGRHTGEHHRFDLANEIREVAIGRVILQEKLAGIDSVAALRGKSEGGDVLVEQDDGSAEIVSIFDKKGDWIRRVAFRVRARLGRDRAQGRVEEPAAP